MTLFPRYIASWRSGAMKTMPVTQFKAHALAVLDEVSKTRQGVLLTKRGKPYAEIRPYGGPTYAPREGTLGGTVVRERDIVAPLGEDWEAAR
ncbi:MAG: hypothetical protein GF331_01035 [Chitinivibrionales bacterium]|nr:hypothetical protein [Chitinivibrionales bacterium]